MGLVNNAIDDSLTKETDLLPAEKTLKASSASYDPAKVDVDPSKQTVSGQLDKVLAADSPLVTRAQAKSTEIANSRGLVNSSMAAQAGTAAAIDAALPIAQADASTYQQAALTDAAATNQSRSQGAAAANTVSLSNADAANKVALTRLDEASQMSLQKLRGDQATTLAQIEANYKQLMQANSSASALFNESMSQISTILRDPSTSEEQKASAVAGVNSLLKSSLSVTGAISNLDLSDLLDFNPSDFARPPAAAPAAAPANASSAASSIVSGAGA